MTTLAGAKKAANRYATSVRTGLGGADVDPAYGLGFRFTVAVEKLDLGQWQTCSGLKVEFKAIDVKKGGEYLAMDWLPDRVVYPKVVLKRATNADSSAKVQQWLDSTARAWLLGDKKSAASNVTITLFDSNNNKVLTWSLAQARPVAWSGPDLDAMSSKLAIETLELVHQGFEVNPASKAGGETASSASGDADKKNEQAFTLSGGGGQVKFKFPPEKVVIVRNKDDRSANQVVQLSQGEGSTALQNKPGVTSYKMDNLILDGDTTGADVRLLLDWATEVKVAGKQGPRAGSHRPTWTSASPSGAAPKSEKKKGAKTGGEKQLPAIEFAWGTGFTATVQLVQITANYTRFSSDGQPLRATVAFTLDVIADKAANGAGNPTSGGIPGRGTHRLLATDSLQLVAREHYDSPGAWRDIARANDIDDPMRVPPGRLLYLPAFSELTEVGERR